LVLLELDDLWWYAVAAADCPRATRGRIVPSPSPLQASGETKRPPAQRFWSVAGFTLTVTMEGKRVGWHNLMHHPQKKNKG
jgi:hypothetical protein